MLQNMIFKETFKFTLDISITFIVEGRTSENYSHPSNV